MTHNFHIRFEPREPLSHYPEGLPLTTFTDTFEEAAEIVRIYASKYPVTIMDFVIYSREALLEWYQRTLDEIKREEGRSLDE